MAYFSISAIRFSKVSFDLLIATFSSAACQSRCQVSAAAPITASALNETVAYIPLQLLQLGLNFPVLVAANGYPRLVNILSRLFEVGCLKRRSQDRSVPELRRVSYSW
jgi:hypothetical protein